MKIKGLVRAFNHTRSQLQTGLKPEEVESFRLRVKTLVQNVEEICRQHGSKPDHLPTPSRMAYAFLKELDLDHLPVTRPGEKVEALTGLKIKNVVKIGEVLAERCWQRFNLLNTSPDERDQLKREIDHHVAAIERVCQQQAATPSAMEGPSKQIYCWLKFLSGEGNLALHLEALQRAKSAVEAQGLRPASPIHLHLTGLGALWRKRQYQSATLLKVNEAFLGADQNVWRALIHNAVSERDPERDRLIREYAESDEFSELLFEIEAFASPTSLSTQGRAHNLEESFDRVNGSYFAGQMPRPNLVWNRTLTTRKFGHYQPARDTLMVSITLDTPRVPAYVIDFVMYHELLHKKHGVRAVNGRRRVHSAVFRADEQRFAHYDEATGYINRLAAEQRALD